MKARRPRGCTTGLTSSVRRKKQRSSAISIGWHRDKKHFDQVFGLSLASACKFRFRRKARNKWERFTLNAQPRSLYVMTGASRHLWEHSIPPVETPRYSITFRTMAQA